MTMEFKMLSPNSAASAKGFKVVLHPAGGMDYSDASGSVRVDSELLVKPSLGIVLYQKSRDLKGMTSSRADEIITNITRALEYLGNRVEKW
jgi:hypothetical protein